MDVQHVRLTLENTPVFFPFQPYDIQKEFMQTVIRSLNNGYHGLLESPTGTGKTLSLLCSSLAWLQKQNGSGKSVIYYTSRTHMQLSQAAKEMKRTAYARHPAVVMGSRTHLCLNQEVKDSGENFINRACRNAIVKNACSYFTNYEQKLESINHESVHDIEDLFQFGRAHQCCPYYASKKLAETKASLIFMPYNYLLDTTLNRNNPLKLNNSVLLIDEAHNIDSVLKDAVSGSFTESNLKTIEQSCIHLPGKLSAALDKEKHGLSRYGYDPSKKLNQVVDEFSKKKDKPEKEVKPNPIEQLASILTSQRLNQVSGCAKNLRVEVFKKKGFEKTKPIDEVYTLMAASGVSYATSDIIIETLNSMSSFWSIAGVMDPAKVAEYVSALSSLSNVIALLFPEECKSVKRQHDHTKKLSECYASHLEGIYKNSQVLQQGQMSDWRYHVWCLYAGFGLKKVISSSSLNGPRSIIFTSGTLEPIESYKKELGIPFGAAKQLRHLINIDQLKISILIESPGSSPYSLVSHHKANIKREYLDALGKTLTPLFKVLPYGTLVMYPSYGLMTRAIEHWKNSKLWSQMTKVTKIFVESKNKKEFESNFNEYQRMFNVSGGMTRAVFMGVFRGKLSEGIDFKGHQCRTILMTGLPFPNFVDPKIMATRQYQAKINPTDKDGQYWYNQQMLRALNQTIGRIIRSREDFGMLILCDPRFERYKWSLSNWTKDFFPSKSTRFPTIVSEIKEFFAKHSIEISETYSEEMGAFELSPFSEELSNRGSVASRSTKGSSNGVRKGLSQNAIEPTISLQERQMAMVASYTVDRETYSQVQSSRVRRDCDQDELLDAKKLKTSDIIEMICSEPELYSQPSGSILQASPNTQQTSSTLPPSVSQPLSIASSPAGLGTQPASSSHSIRISPICSNTQQSSSCQPRKRTNPFAQKKKKILKQMSIDHQSPSESQSSPAEAMQVQSQNSASTTEYSVMRQLDENQASSYRCSVCEGETDNAHETNCDCRKV